MRSPKYGDKWVIYSGMNSESFQYTRTMSRTNDICVLGWHLQGPKLSTIGLAASDLGSCNSGEQTAHMTIKHFDLPCCFARQRDTAHRRHNHAADT